MKDDNGERFSVVVIDTARQSLRRWNGAMTIAFYQLAEYFEVLQARLKASRQDMRDDRAGRRELLREMRETLTAMHEEHRRWKVASDNQGDKESADTSEKRKSTAA